MNLGHALYWGFAGTIVLTTLMAGSRGLGLTRMDLPFMLGTMFTPNRDKAKWLGITIHTLNGWAFAFLYIAAFQLTGMSTWWFGAAIGLVHAMFILLVGVRLLPGFHPRMADELRGPDPTRQLEPPGYLALHYGRGTPITTIVAHVIYGAILGLFYT
jgi:hypothetical protein